MDLIDQLRDWTPIRIYPTDNGFYVDWCYMGSERFTDSFFDSTIERRFRTPYNLLFRHQTPIDVLGSLHQRRPGLAPNGFIFHMSRCGSTLVSQMLATLDRNIMLSEPPAIDNVLRSNSRDPSVTDAQRIDWLQWLISGFGQPRNGETHLFIKLDSWSTLDLDLIARAFPDVPWIFLYRDPVEVIVSQMRQRGAQMVPGAIGPILPGVDVAQLFTMPAEEYCARILGRICDAALEHASSTNGLFVNYDQLPRAVMSGILPHFRTNISPSDADKMDGVTQFDAKTPQMTFDPENRSKREQASPAARAAADKWLAASYQKLENISTAQSKPSDGGAS